MRKVEPRDDDPKRGRPQHKLRTNASEKQQPRDERDERTEDEEPRA